MFQHTFRNTVCLLFFIFMVSGITAQEFVGHKEVGLGFYGLNFNGSNSFSAFYKKEKSENVYLRFNFFTGTIDAQFNKYDQNRLTSNIGIGVGKEHRRKLDDKLWFYSGPQFSASVNSNISNFNTKYVNLSLGMGYVFGLQHHFNDRWAMNIELQPTLNGSFYYQNKDKYVFSAGVSNLNNTVRLNVLRRF